MVGATETDYSVVNMGQIRDRLIQVQQADLEEVRQRVKGAAEAVCAEEAKERARHVRMVRGQELVLEGLDLLADMEDPLPDGLRFHFAHAVRELEKLEARLEPARIRVRQTGRP